LLLIESLQDLDWYDVGIYVPVTILGCLFYFFFLLNFISIKHVSFFLLNFIIVYFFVLKEAKRLKDIYRL